MLYRHSIPKLGRGLFKLFSFILLALSASSCDWISLTCNALTYRTTGTGEVGNIVALGRVAYVTRAEQGLEIIDLSTGEKIQRMAPPSGSESIDDLALADGFLFTLDARPPGSLTIFSMADPKAPQQVSGPVPVPVGPFSGVSASAGRVIVSGGTSDLTLRSYDRDGRLGEEVASIDLGRGQPDVLLAPGGQRAFVSTHFSGPHFGLMGLDMSSGSLTIAVNGRLDLETIGFTAGGAKPANFPIEAALHHDSLLIAYTKGLALVDPKELKILQLIKAKDLGVEPVNVDASGQTVAVVGSAPRPMLVLLSIQSPGGISVQRSIPLPEGTYATGVAVTSDHVAVAGHEKGVLIFKI